eukprot:2549400-Pyramimonas_sp.AAC.1
MYTVGLGAIALFRFAECVIDSFRVEDHLGRGGWSSRGTIENVEKDRKVAPRRGPTVGSFPLLSRGAVANQSSGARPTGSNQCELETEKNFHVLRGIHVYHGTAGA